MTYDRVKKSSWTPPAKTTSSFFPQTHIQTKKETKPSWEVTGVHTTKEAMERIRRSMFGSVEPIVEAPKETAPQEAQHAVIKNKPQISHEESPGSIRAYKDKRKKQSQQRIFVLLQSTDKIAKSILQGQQKNTLVLDQKRSKDGWDTHVHYNGIPKGEKQVQVTSITITAREENGDRVGHQHLLLQMSSQGLPEIYQIDKDGEPFENLPPSVLTILETTKKTVMMALKNIFKYKS